MLRIIRGEEKKVRRWQGDYQRKKHEYKNNILHTEIEKRKVQK